MIDCREAARLASRALDEKLSLRQRLGVTLHLRACEACRRYRRDLEALHRLLRSGVEKLEEIEALAAQGLSAADRDALERRLREAVVPDA